MPSRWPTIRAEAARVLDTTERSELRDTEVALTRARLSEQMAGGLSEAERMLAAELISPLIVPNSSFSQTLTQQEQDRRAAAVTPVMETVLQGQVLVRGGTQLGEVDAARLAAFGLDKSTPDVASLAGWFLLSALLVALLLGWIWRFRRDFWHRNNVLVLISLLMLFATVGLKLTAGRAALPFVLPLAAIPILIAVLLDAEVAILVAALVARRRRRRQRAVARVLRRTSSSAAWPVSSAFGGEIGCSRSSRPAALRSSSRRSSWRRSRCSASAT